MAIRPRLSAFGGRVHLVGHFAAMGNRSSSSPYSPHTLPYGKRPPPAAYIEPYVDYPHRATYSHPPPQGIFMDRRLGGSRLSLNAVPVEPIIIPDLKTLKKLEKMDKKQRKIMKVSEGKGD